MYHQCTNSRIIVKVVGGSQIMDSAVLGYLIFPVLLFLLLRIPLKAAKRGGTPGVRVE